MKLFELKQCINTTEPKRGQTKEMLKQIKDEENFLTKLTQPNLHFTIF